MMDYGNSGGLQSSSGGDEDQYDPRSSESFPTFLTTNPISTNYLDAFSQSQPNQNPHSLLNHLDVVLSGGLQLDHPNNYSTTLVGNLTGSSTTTMLRPVHEKGSGIVKINPKKRTRASRSAPTTILTTDTSNFREMVQELTGLPAPPFSSASSFSRRLDLFGTGSAAMRSSRLMEPLGSSSFYPLRPPPLVSSTTTTSNTNLNSNIGKYQSDQDIFLNEPMLTFQSLLQPPQVKYPITSEGPCLGTKSQGSSLIEELRISHENVNVNAKTSWRDGAGSNDDHCHEKELEMINNVSSRGGGRADSWICPSG